MLLTVVSLPRGNFWPNDCMSLPVCGRMLRYRRKYKNVSYYTCNDFRVFSGLIRILFFFVEFWTMAKIWLCISCCLEKQFLLELISKFWTRQWSRWIQNILIRDLEEFCSYVLWIKIMWTGRGLFRLVTKSTKRNNSNESKRKSEDGCGRLEIRDER